MKSIEIKILRDLTYELIEKAYQIPSQATQDRYASSGAIQNYLKKLKKHGDAFKWWTERKAELLTKETQQEKNLAASRLKPKPRLSISRERQRVQRARFRERKLASFEKRMNEMDLDDLLAMHKNIFKGQRLESFKKMSIREFKYRSKQMKDDPKFRAAFRTIHRSRKTDAAITRRHHKLEKSLAKASYRRRIKNLSLMDLTKEQKKLNKKDEQFKKGLEKLKKRVTEPLVLRAITLEDGTKWSPRFTIPYSLVEKYRRSVVDANMAKIEVVDQLIEERRNPSEKLKLSKQQQQFLGEVQSSYPGASKILTSEAKKRIKRSFKPRLTKIMAKDKVPSYIFTLRKNEYGSGLELKPAVERVKDKRRIHTTKEEREQAQNWITKRFGKKTSFSWREMEKMGLTKEQESLIVKKKKPKN